jgi:DNA mismatch repair protein MutS
MPDKNENEFSTPMMKQYFDLKAKYSDCILFFRLGDFYEMFMDDAKLGSQILNITLTSRDRGKDGRVPMAGVPYHAVDSYLAKMVRAGYKVAICEQLTEPGGPGLVERDVVRIVTPGTVLDDNSLEKKENNYIVGLHFDEDIVGLAVSDISTGTFFASQYPRNTIRNVLLNELTRFSPSECILSEAHYNSPEILKLLKVHQNLNIFPFDAWEKISSRYQNFLQSHFGLVKSSTFGLEAMPCALKASAGLLGYLKYTQKDKVGHIKNIKPILNEEFVQLDRSTISNLELVSSIKDGSKNGTLLKSMDRTITPQGGRLLKTWLLHPLNNLNLLEERLDAVELLIKEKKLREDLKEKLFGITDIERIVSRLAVGIGSPKDLVSLKNSLTVSKEIKKLLDKVPSKLFTRKSQELSPEVLSLADLIEKTIEDNPPFDPKSGGVIKVGVDAELDKLKKRIHSSKEFIAKLEERERKRTKINSLKVRFNQVFGYYIEITRSNLENVPNDYIRKQTLVNAERFITPDLKEHEEIILTAEEKIKVIEYEKFNELVSEVLSKTENLQTCAQAIAVLDCLVSFALLALEKDYVRPEFVSDENSTKGDLKIVDGRHPVVEDVVGRISFVPNDTLLNSSDHQLLIITGPNMAGKSVYIRQVAVIVLMAQMGSFVPARSAQLSLVDKIFVRSGASDAISLGLSTFMVEMVETSHILNNATSKSLIVMDEIGRGTSTYDGISIAWAVAEFLVNSPNTDLKIVGSGPKTLFATHYHELQDLETKFPERIKNYQIAVEENSGDPVFLHKVKKGGAGHSFGIAVAKLAGVPQEVCERAGEILNTLRQRAGASQSWQPETSPPQSQSQTQSPTLPEASSLKVSGQVTIPYGKTSGHYLGEVIVSENIDEEFIRISEKLHQLDLSRTTPLEALNILAELKDCI